jgi:hypothetical protein
MKTKKTSFLKQLIKDAWDVAVEHARYMKAMRILSKQEWSVEFLVSLLKTANSPLRVVIRNGTKELVISRDTPVETKQPSTLSEHDLMEYLGMIPQQEHIV